VRLIQRIFFIIGFLIPIADYPVNPLLSSIIYAPDSVNFFCRAGSDSGRKRDRQRVAGIWDGKKRTVWSARQNRRKSVRSRGDAGDQPGAIYGLKRPNSVSVLSFGAFKAV